MFGVAGLRAQALRPGPDGGAARRLRARIGYGLWSLHWVAGHVAGGAILGAALGWAGSLLADWHPSLALALLGAVCLLGGLRQLRWLRGPLPHWPRQVPRTWLLLVPWDLIAWGYGIQLGCGVATRIKVATTHVVLVFALLSGSALAGALILSCFGAARAVLPVVLGPAVASPGRSLGIALSFDEHEDRVARYNGVLLLATAVFLLGYSWLWVGA